DPRDSEQVLLAAADILRRFPVQHLAKQACILADGNEAQRAYLPLYPAQQVPAFLDLLGPRSPTLCDIGCIALGQIDFGRDLEFGGMGRERGFGSEHVVEIERVQAASPQQSRDVDFQPRSGDYALEIRNRGSDCVSAAPLPLIGEDAGKGTVLPLAAAVH